MKCDHIHTILLQLPDQLLRNKEIEKMTLTFKEFIVWSGEGIERE